MSTGKIAKANFTMEVTSDRLTSLPEDLKCDIISRLNFQEVVRTSILSSTWRETWTTVPNILLCDRAFAQSKFITLVDKVLSLRKGPLLTFTISGKERYHDVFDGWMLRLSENSPKSVTIELPTGPKYKIPSSLFYIRLEHLDLNNCIISLPHNFKGFDLLTSLDLDIVSITDKDINNLVSRCPMLSVLRLHSFEGIKCLSIRAPELEYLEVNGMFEDIHLDAPKLKHADVTLLKAESYQSVAVDDGKRHMNHALQNLRYIKALSLNGYVLKYLSRGIELSAVFFRLEYIFLEICFWDPREVWTAYALFCNAPMLNEVELRSFPWTEKFVPMSTYQASIEELTLPMDHLVTFSVKDFLGLDDEVSFIGKLLSWAPVLEKVKIEGASETEEIMVLKKLLTLPRLSQNAKIIFA